MPPDLCRAGRGSPVLAYAGSMGGGRGQPRFYLTADPIERVEIPTLFDAGVPHVAPAQAHDFPPLAFEWSDEFPESAAYPLVLQTLEWFGCEGATIPFLDHERCVVDSAALRDRLAGSGLSVAATG